MIRSALKNIARSNFISEILFRPEDNDRNPAWFIEVDPKHIKYISLIPENSEYLIGENAKTGVCCGYWDKLKRPFRKHSHHKTVSEILNDVQFHKTSMFQKVNKGRIKRREALRICKKLERIMGKLQHKGYLSQYEMDKLDTMWPLGELPIPVHETVVGMDRNGDLVRLVGGKHRLAVAQQIGIKKIPAILSIYHKDALDNLPEKRRRITGNPDDFMPFSETDNHKIKKRPSLSG